MRTCEHCGANLPDSSSFCTNCGSPVAPQPATTPEQTVPPQPEYQPPEYQPQAQQPPMQAVSYQQVPPQQPYYPQQPGMAYPPNPEGEKKATTCLVMGLLSFFLSCIPILPIVLSLIGIAQYKYAKNTNKSGTATVGLVFSILGLVGGVIMVIYYAIFILAFIASDGKVPMEFSYNFGGRAPY